MELGNKPIHVIHNGTHRVDEPPRTRKPTNRHLALPVCDGICK